LEKPFPAYQGNDPYVFVCYAHEDCEVVYPEIAKLHELGINIWYDEGISPGKNWRAAIGDSLLSSERVLFYISERSVASEHCNREINLALDERKDIVPVYLEDAELTSDLKVGLSRVQALFHSFDANHLVRVAEALRSPAVSKKLSPIGEHRSSVEPTITILPFETLSEDAELEEFAKIVQQDLIHSISLTELKVLDQSSANFVVSGNLRRAEDGVQLRFQIALAKDGRIYWSRTLELGSEQLRSQQLLQAPYFAEITRKVVETATDSRKMTTRSDYAREELVRGLIEFEELAQGTGGNAHAMQAHLLASIEADPEFPWPIGLMIMYYKNRMGGQTFADAVGPAHEFAGRFLSLRPRSTFPIATINANLDLDFQAALVNFEHARKRNEQTLGEIESEIGQVMLWQGKLNEAVEKFKAAEHLFGGTNRKALIVGMALAYLAAGRYREARQAAEKSLAVTNNKDFDSLLIKIWACHYLDESDSASKTLDFLMTNYGVRRPEYLPGVLALLDKADLAMAALEEGEKRFKLGKLARASEGFWGHFHLGNIDEACDWLRRSIDNREYWLFPMLHRSPILDCIRDDSRFKEAMRYREEVESLGTPTKSIAYP
jgi:TolB-like protein